MEEYYGQEKNEQFGKQPEKPSGGKAGLVWIAAGIFALIALVFFALELWLSMSDYKMARGLASAPIVGLENYTRVLSGSLDRLFIGWTAYSGLAALVMTVVMGLAGMGLSKAGRGGVWAAAAAGLAMAAVPQCWLIAAATSIRMPEAIDILFYAMTWGGISLAASALIGKAWRRRSVFSAFIVPAMYLMLLFTGAGGTTAMSHGMYMRVDEYIYSRSLSRMQFGMGSAANTMATLAGLLPAIGGMVLLLIAALRRKPESELAVRRAPFLSMLPGIAAAGLLLIAGAALMFTGRPISMNSVTMIGSTAAEAALALVLGFGVYFLVFLLSGKTNGGATFGYAIFVFAALSVCRFTILKLLAAYALGLRSSVVPVAVDWVLNPLVMTLAASLTLLRPRKASQCLLPALGMAALAVVFGITNPTPSSVYVTADFSRAFLNFLMTNGRGNADMMQTLTPAQIAGMNAAYGRYVAGILMLLTAVPFGAGLALTVRLSESRE